MKKIEIVGYHRTDLGKEAANKLRNDGYVPGVLYGGDKVVHFYAPIILFKPLIYTNEAHFVTLNIEGAEYECILQDAQFHPVNDMIVHADFLLIQKERPLKMQIPVRLKGVAPGVAKGGKLYLKQRTLKISALPENMPEFIELSISKLNFGKSLRVKDVEQNNFMILNPESSPIVAVEIPRALRGKQQDDEDEDESEEAEEVAS
mgnify:CR=1 FL=1